MDVMKRIVNLLATLGENAKVNEELSRITIEGIGLSVAIVKAIHDLATELDLLDLHVPTCILDEQPVDVEKIVPENGVLNTRWRIVLGKSDLTNKVFGNNSEAAVFMSEAGFLSWLSKEDPFSIKAGTDRIFTTKATFRIAGYKGLVFGPALIILGLDTVVPALPVLKPPLPDERTVQEQVRVVGVRAIRLRPQYWAITGGETTSEIAVAFSQKSAMVLAACLSQQISEKNDALFATYKGSGKKSELAIVPSILPPAALPVFAAALAWAFEERTETRIKLIADRLAVDADVNLPIADALSPHIAEAFQQAKDSYDFVIADRKDAYHKELRDFMKDVKGQADLLAAKVRDLVGSLTRDALGVLVLFGFSFIGKFDAQKLAEMIASKEFELLAKALSGYLLFAGATAILVAQRDAVYGFREINNWFEILQNYSSKEDFKNRVLAPLNERRKFLNRALFFIGLIYLLLAASIWNLPKLIIWLTT
jgi:hypothetical protein